MADNDLLLLMEAYAILGYEEWNQTTPGKTKVQEKMRLQYRIVESDWQVQNQIRNVHSREPTNFFPIRKHRHDGIDRCFFMPRKVGDDEVLALAFDLVLFVTEEILLAFRFEPADRPEYSHNFPHVQFCRMVAGRQLDLTGVPPWIPDSYPAFPLPSSDPLRLFLAMLVAVHGRWGGAENVIRETFQKVGRPAGATPYIQLTNEMLDAGIIATESG